MRIIKKIIPDNIKSVDILTLSDLHIGEPSCDMKYIQEQIEYIKNTPNCYTILNGDLIDNAIKTSIGDVYSQTLKPQEQVNKIVSLLSPIRDKILAVNNGNHEERTYRDAGIDLMSCVCVALGIEDVYCNESAYIFLQMNIHERIKRNIIFTIYCTHGRGGGRKEGSKAIRLADMASICDADIYIHSHTHMPLVMKQSFYRNDVQHKTVTKIDRLFVNTGASLDYAKYAEKNEFKPTSMSNPLIHIWYEFTPKVKRKALGYVKKQYSVTL